MKKPTSALEYAGHRVSLALRRRSIMPALALQYRLCEVGAPRLDPRDLANRLGRLCADGEHVILVDGLYAAPDMGSTERRKRSTIAFDTLSGLDLTVRGTSLKSEEIVRNAAHTVASKLRNADWEIEETRRIGSEKLGRLGPTERFLIRRPDGRAPLLVQVSHTENWLYPDDAEFWTHAKQAMDAGAHPIYLTRKVAPITFPLLGLMNARALQYYNLLTAEAVSPTSAQAANNLGLPICSSAAGLAEQSVFSHLIKFLHERPGDEWTPGMPAAFNAAVERGFTERPIDASIVADWAEENLGIASAWAAGVRMWADGRERPRRIPPPRKQVSTVPPAEAGKTIVSRVPFRV